MGIQLNREWHEAWECGGSGRRDLKTGGTRLRPEGLTDLAPGRLWEPCGELCGSIPGSQGGLPREDGLQRTPAVVSRLCGERQTKPISRVPGDAARADDAKQSQSEGQRYAGGRGPGVQNKANSRLTAGSRPPTTVVTWTMQNKANFRGPRPSRGTRRAPGVQNKANLEGRNQPVGELEAGYAKQS